MAATSGFGNMQVSERMYLGTREGCVDCPNDGAADDARGGDRVPREDSDKECTLLCDPEAGREWTDVRGSNRHSSELSARLPEKNVFRQQVARFVAEMEGEDEGRAAWCSG